MRRLTHLVVLVAFVFSCGGNWAVFQCIAWANMIREYSQMVPVTKAIQMTFSGDYPCALCKAIAEKKQSEKAKMLTLQKQEKQICPTDSVTAKPSVTVSPRDFLVRDSFLRTRSDSPPTPPPRFA